MIVEGDPPEMAISPLRTANSSLRMPATCGRPKHLVQFFVGTAWDDVGFVENLELGGQTRNTILESLGSELGANYYRISQF